jgi:hypothetical protein
MAPLVAALSCSSSTPSFVFPYLGCHDPKGKPIRPLDEDSRPL